jgi:hypothetical protein
VLVSCGGLGGGEGVSEVVGVVGGGEGRAEGGSLHVVGDEGRKERSDLGMEGAEGLELGGGKRGEEIRAKDGKLVIVEGFEAEVFRKGSGQR